MNQKKFRFNLLDDRNNILNSIVCQKVSYDLLLLGDIKHLNLKKGIYYITSNDIKNFKEKFYFTKDKNVINITKETDKLINLLKDNELINNMYFLPDEKNETWFIVDSNETEEKFDSFIKKNTNLKSYLLNITYEDQCLTCDNCNCIIHINCSYPDFYFLNENDNSIYCKDCTDKKDYLKSILNNYKKANNLLTHDELKKLGFQKYNKDICKNGLHSHDNDNPKEIYNQLKKENNDILFSIDNIDIFTIKFNIYIRNGGKKQVE